MVRNKMNGFIWLAILGVILAFGSAGALIAIGFLPLK